MAADAVVDAFDLAAGVPPSTVAAGIEGELRPKPKASRGMSKKVIGLLFVLVSVLFIVFIISLDAVDQGTTQTTKKVDEEEKSVSGSQAPTDMLTDKKGPVPGVADVPAETSATDGKAVVPGAVNSDGKPFVPAAVPAAAPAASPLSPEEQLALKAKMDRDARMAQARAVGLEVRGFTEGATPKATTTPGTGMNGAGSASAGGMSALGGFGGGTGSNAPEATGDQEQKLKFIKDGGTASGGYHLSTVVPPLSPFQLNAGSFIPSILGTAVNSDMPGTVTAQVRENVYASVHDRCLLLPSMSQLFGSYDSRVAIGQNRQLVVWNRVTFPNGNELNLAGMMSADEGGQSGLEADVDNHWLRLFGVALGMSAVTAGVQLSVPAATTSTNGASTTTPAQAVSTALTQQFGQLGGQVMGKYLNIQPTLRNYPGERFNIVVPKNIVFPGCYR